MQKTFTWKTDENGTDGWIPDSNPSFWASDARIVAHDTLEHFQDDTGDAAGELQALGAVLLGRLQHDSNLTSKGLASDLTFLAWQIADQMPTTAKISRKLSDDYAEEILGHALQNFRESEEAIESSITPEQLQHVLSFIRTGYRRALRRYKNGFRLFSLFHDLQTAVEEAERRNRYREHGQRLIANVNISTGRVSVAIRDSWDDF